MVPPAINESRSSICHSDLLPQNRRQKSRPRVCMEGKFTPRVAEAPPLSLSLALNVCASSDLAPNERLWAAVHSFPTSSTGAVIGCPRDASLADEAASIWTYELEYTVIARVHRALGSPAAGRIKPNIFANDSCLRPSPRPL